MARDGAGNLYIADQVGNVIRKIDTSGIVSTIAGTGIAGTTGDGGSALSATLAGPLSIAVDASGNVFITDRLAVRKISIDGTINKVVGGGTTICPATGSGTGVAINPRGLAVDSSGALYISEVAGNCVLKLTSDGTVTRVAGSGTPGYSGDGGPATNAKLYNPWGMAFDPAGNLYIADRVNGAIRKITPAGTISTLTKGSLLLTDPEGLAIDSSGNLLATGYNNELVVQVSISGAVTAIAGNPKLTTGFSGDGGPATSAQLDGPAGIAIDSAGRIYFSEWSNHRIRLLTPQGGGSPPTFTLSSTSVSLGAGASTGTVTVTASSSTATWAATSSVSWIIITSGSSGVGNGTVSYSIAANASTSARTGTLTIAGLTFTVNQAGASATGTPTPVTYSYDTGGHLVRASYGATGSVAYSYDAAGNLIGRTIVPSNAPMITSVRTASGGDSAKNTHIVIKGANLVPPSTSASGVTRSGAPAFGSGQRPTQLNGVSVTVNGKPADIDFACSATTGEMCVSDQINILVPPGSVTGPLTLVVTSGNTVSPPYTVNLNAAGSVTTLH